MLVFAPNYEEPDPERAVHIDEIEQHLAGPQIRAHHTLVVKDAYALVRAQTHVGRLADAKLVLLAASPLLGDAADLAALVNLLRRNDGLPALSPDDPGFPELRVEMEENDREHRQSSQPVDLRDETAGGRFPRAKPQNPPGPTGWLDRGWIGGNHWGRHRCGQGSANFRDERRKFSETTLGPSRPRTKVAGTGSRPRRPTER